MTALRITHIGGPMVLIEVDGWRLLTDPTSDPPGGRCPSAWRSRSPHDPDGRQSMGPAPGAPWSAADLELMSTLSGQPLYEAAGFDISEHVEDASGGTPVPLVRMRKPITPAVDPPGS